MNQHAESEIGRTEILNPKSEISNWTARVHVHSGVSPVDKAKADQRHKRMPGTNEGRYNSVNYAAARAAESRADLVRKLRIVLKQLIESVQFEISGFWI
jgi:hypothetical protein